MLRCRSFVAVVFFTLILGVIAGCTGPSTGPSGPGPVETQPTSNSISIESINPATSGVVFHYDDPVFARVHYSYSQADWSTATRPGLYICSGRAPDRIIVTCSGRGVTSQSGYVDLAGGGVKSYWPFNTITETGYIIIIQTKDTLVSLLPSGMDAEMSMNLPISSFLTPPAAFEAREVYIKWVQ